MTHKKLKVVFLAAEITPIAKVGGLGDVAGALPKALAQNGIEVIMFLPFYGLIDRKKFRAQKIKSKIKIIIDGKNDSFDLYKTFLPDSSVPVYLIKHKFFNAEEIYSSGVIMKGKRYLSNITDLHKYAFFSKAVTLALKAINEKPDVFHLNDWHVALVADLIKDDPFYKKTKTIYTIHNLNNQGITKENIVKFININPNLPTIKKDLENGDLNFMVQGILNSNIFSTVSKTYAKEIQTKEYSAGLERIIKLKKKNLYGIVNGIDVDFYNPEKDALIKANYSLKNPAGKEINRENLIKKFGLAPKLPIISFISRFVWQKGSDLIIEDFAKLEAQFIFLGTGEKKYEDALSALSKKYPEKFKVIIKFDEPLAHELYAGSDIFLVPSRYEPCGLTQMIAMRYGTVPIVRKTGGLADTVVNHPPPDKGG